MACMFKKTQSQICPKSAEKLTPDALYWKNLEFPITEKKNAAVSHIEFSPVAPYDYAVTSSTMVQLYSHRSNHSIKSLTRSHDTSHCGSYRSDGLLLVAGSDDSIVRVYHGKKVLSHLKGHTSSVHVTRFLRDNKRVFSGSDDKTVKLWDMAIQQELISYSEHQDYVRCGVASQASSDIILTGSYDHTVKLFDVRTPASVLTVNHGHPVESVLMFPAGNLFLSAGGNVVKVWDACAGGRLVAQFSNHHKTITSLCFASGYRRLVSASLDKHVKFYDTGSYQVVHSLEYPSAVLSVAVSPSDDLIAVGMTDGLLSIRRRRDDSEILAAEREKIKRKKSMSGRVWQPLHSYSVQPDKNVEVIQHNRKTHLDKYDVYLRKFEYTKALDAVMDVRLRVKTPSVTVGVIRELIRRNGLRTALAGRDDEAVARIVTFILKNISEAQFVRTLLDVLSIIIELYWDRADVMVRTREVMTRVSRAIDLSYDVSLEKAASIGLCDIILSSVSDSTVDIEPIHSGLTNGISSEFNDSDEDSDKMDTQS